MPSDDSTPAQDPSWPRWTIPHRYALAWFLTVFQPWKVNERSARWGGVERAAWFASIISLFCFPALLLGLKLTTHLFEIQTLLLPVNPTDLSEGMVAVAQDGTLTEPQANMLDVLVESMMETEPPSTARIVSTYLLAFLGGCLVAGALAFSVLGAHLINLAVMAKIAGIGWKDESFWRAGLWQASFGPLAMVTYALLGYGAGMSSIAHPFKAGLWWVGAVLVVWLAAGYGVASFSTLKRGAPALRAGVAAGVGVLVPGALIGARLLIQVVL